MNLILSKSYSIIQIGKVAVLLLLSNENKKDARYPLFFFSLSFFLLSILLVGKKKDIGWRVCMCMCADKDYIINTGTGIGECISSYHEAEDSSVGVDAGGDGRYKPCS